jgi:ribonucleotide monophosphatase NagD (HAD superfamily)
MYKVLIASANAHIEGLLNQINKENGKIVFVTNDSSMYFIYEVTEHRSEI